MPKRSVQVRIYEKQNRIIEKICRETGMSKPEALRVVLEKLGNEFIKELETLNRINNRYGIKFKVVKKRKR